MEKRHVKASEGMTFKRKVDGYIMGNEMFLGKFIDGTDDVVENYEEVVDESPVRVERMTDPRRIQSKLES